MILTMRRFRGRGLGNAEAVGGYEDWDWMIWTMRRFGGRGLDHTEAVGGYGTWDWAEPVDGAGAMAAAGGLVQYVVVRGDLRARGWTLGALVAQACHGSVAAIQLSRDHPDTQAYLQRLDGMATVVLEAPDEESLTSLSQMLTEAAVVHKLWIEQPENTATCLALKPYPKEQVQKLLKKLKLLK